MRKKWPDVKLRSLTLKSENFQLFMLILVLLSVLACAQEAPPNPSDFSAPGATPKPANTETPTNTPIPTPTVTATPISDLRLGYTDRGMNCPLITEIVALALEEELAMSVGRSEYETAEDLFAALASGEVNLTLCFLDPEDRPYIKEYLDKMRREYGYISQDKKLGIMVNLNSFRIIQEMQCVNLFFKKIDFESHDFQNSTAKQWFDSHPEIIESWVDCGDLSP